MLIVTKELNDFIYEFLITALVIIISKRFLFETCVTFRYLERIKQNKKVRNKQIFFFESYLNNQFFTLTLTSTPVAETPRRGDIVADRENVLRTVFI